MQHRIFFYKTLNYMKKILMAQLSGEAMIMVNMR